MKKRAYIYITFTMIVWGMSFVSIKYLLRTYDAVELTTNRYILSTIFFVFLVLIKKDSFKFNKKHWKEYLISSVVGVFIYYLLENSSLFYIDASTMALFLALTPIAMIVTNSFLKIERITKHKSIAGLLSIIGVILVVVGDATSLTAGKLLGYVLISFAIITWVIYNIYTEKLTKYYSHLSITANQSIIALFCFLVLSLFSGFNISNMNLTIGINYLFLGVISSGLCFYLYVKAMNIIGSTTTTIFMNFMPVVTMIAGYFLLNEEVTTIKVLGGIIIIFSMTYLSYKDIKKLD